jgi:hypothetical protein
MFLEKISGVIDCYFMDCMNRLFVCFVVFIPFFGFSQEPMAIDVPKYTQEAFLKFDFLSVQMPGSEPTMGLSGIHYNLNAGKSIYLGVGLYGAVTGIRGGFFSLGVNAGFKKDITSKCYVDAGLYFGGGGGARTPDGGGAFILPHFNVGTHFSKFDISAGYSYINFFDFGDIKGHQLVLDISLPVSFDYAPYRFFGKNLDLENPNTVGDWYKQTKLSSFRLGFDNLIVKAGLDGNGGFKEDKSIGLMGIEYDSYFDRNGFLFVKGDAAYRGIMAGYMDIFLGAGYGLPINNDSFKLLAKFSMGAGGGGGVDTQGGFLVAPTVGLEKRIGHSTYLGVDVGYLLTPNRYFVASNYSFGIKYYLNQSGILSSEGKPFQFAKFKGFEMIVGQEVYINTVRTKNKPTQDLYKIMMQFNYSLNKYCYAIGQTSFADFGNGGAYAEGIVGFGFKYMLPSANKFSFNAQLMAGTGGGGDVNTGDGILLKSSLGMNYNFSEKLGIATSFGKAIARGDALNSTMFNVGLNYRISFLMAKNK